MTERGARSRQRRRRPQRETAGGGKRSADYRNLRNPFPPVPVFSDDEVAAIEAHGSGLAQEQYPSPNEALTAGDPIKVVFGAARVELREALNSASEGGG